MKTTNSILKSGIQFLIIVSAVSATCLAKENNKIYQITDEGDYHYKFYDVDQANKEGTKPIMARTFYLETYRKGLIPRYISYEEFLELSVEEQRALLTNRQQFLTVDNKEPEPLQNTLITTNEGVEKPFDKVPLTSDTELGSDHKLPWIIQVMVDPYDGYQFPEGFKENQLGNLPSAKKNIYSATENKTADILLQDVTNTCPVTEASACKTLP